MKPTELALIAGGAVLALGIGLGAGGIARAPMERALASHPMVAVPGTSQFVAAAPMEASTPQPAALPAHWGPRAEATPAAYAEAAAPAEDSNLGARDASARADPQDAAYPPAAVRDQAYARRDLGGAEEVTPNYRPPPRYDWPGRYADPPRPPPPPPYMVASPGDDGESPG
jgi:hypothetical protein